VCILFPKCRRRLICAASHASISESERERERERERREEETLAGSFNWSTIEPVISLMTVMIVPAGPTSRYIGSSVFSLSRACLHTETSGHLSDDARRCTLPLFARARARARPLSSPAHLHISSGPSTMADRTERPRLVNRLAWLALLI